MSLDGRVQPHPGALTSSFLAARLPEGPRVLRVAQCIGGKIVDERRFERGARVTVGGRGDATFTTVVTLGDDRLRLFDVHAKGARLAVPRGATGRAQTTTGLVELRRKHGETIDLDDHARGVVTLGDVTFLFAFEAERVVVRPTLPTNVRRGFELDAQTFFVAAISFLLHFAALGALYSDWADPVFDDDLTVTALVEAVRDLPSTPPMVEETPDANPTEVATPTTKTAAASKASPGARTASASRGATQPSTQRMSDRDAANLSRDLASLDIEMQGVLNPNGASTDRVLRDGEIPLGMLNEAAAASRAVRPGLSLGSSASTVGRGSAGTLAELGSRGEGDGGLRGDAKRADGPNGKQKKAPDPAPTNGGVPGAEAVIARMSGAFHRCYQNGLDREDPNMAGSVRVLTRVGPNGEVTGASPSVSGNVSGTVVACIQRKVMGAQFSPPTGGGTASLMIPISLDHQ